MISKSFIRIAIDRMYSYLSIKRPYSIKRPVWPNSEPSYQMTSTISSKPTLPIKQPVSIKRPVWQSAKLDDQYNICKASPVFLDL